MNEAKTPWAAWFRFGVGALRLAPRDFWRLSLWEWLELIGAQTTPAPTYAELEALMRAHPDLKAG
jgi:uncharacterized phage protein (TIGR02216 family)